MLRYTTASDLIADLRRYYHPDEPLLIVSVSGQDIKQRLADKYPDDDCGEPTESSIVAAMRQVESAMQRSDEDARLEDRIIDAMPTSDCDCPHCGRDLDPGESLCGDSDCPRHDNA
jgi:hypothetical protein